MATVQELRIQGILAASDGHPFVDFDEYKAMRLIARLKEIGAATANVSPDLCHMLCAWDSPYHVHTHGFKVVCDETLPPNSIVDPMGVRSHHPEVARR